MRVRVISVLVLIGSPALAAGVIEVKRGEDSTVFGNCVPSLGVENNSAETVDFLEVDLAMTVSDGRVQSVALRSAYRDGIHFPIAPGATATLKQQLDLEKPLGVSCGEVKERRVTGTLCQLSDGKPCGSQVKVVP